jgi:ribosome biogenesis GTPase A
VSSKPLAYLVDTPGVMIPNVENADVGLKLALTGNQPSRLCVLA